MEQPKVVPPAEWLAARRELLKKEKEFSRLRDQLSKQRRELPWEKVEKIYVFDGPKGKETLADLFGGRSQLIVYHFMLGPGWAEGCPSCSFISDHIDGSVVHLAARDVRLAVVSRAPLAEIAAFKKRMGWRFHWGVVERDRLQLRLPSVDEEGRVGERRSLLQLRNATIPKRGTTWHKRVLQGRSGQYLPHLFELRSRAGHPHRCVQLAGPYA
jgi:predicted dithiol-disulfide oxidoreductase (DUF899 family)